ncbi:MAG: lipoprotein signal peptidase [Chitinivorax sp.]
MQLKEALIYWLRGRIAASRGARKLAYLYDMSRFLRAGLLAIHPARRINQRFPKEM